MQAKFGGFYVSLIDTYAQNHVDLLKRNDYIDPNIDFYSGALYYMLDVPPSLFTAFFAIARIVGWSAHRLEELIASSKIIRPAYKSVMKTEE